MGIMKKEKIKEFLIGLAIFAVICAGFYLYVFWEFDPIYGINDDWTLYMVISGSYLGYPEPHVNYMMYPLACLLCGLYSITSEIPWYGIMLQGFVALCGFFLYFRIYYRLSKGIKRHIFSVLGLLVFLCSHIGIIIAIQYTQVGAICGATAIFLFLTADTKGKGCKEYLMANIPTIIMATISLNMRENTLYMCLPIAGMILIAKWFVEDRKITKEVIVRYSGLVFVLGVCLGGTIITHEIAYSSPEWKEYVRVNDIWTVGWDYYGFPKYEEIEEFLTENGMTQADYEVALAYQTFYRGEMKYSDYLTVITNAAKEKYDAQHTFQVKLNDANEKIVNSLTRSSLRPLNLTVVLLFVTVIFLMFYTRNRMVLVPLLCYLFGRFFAWYFLLFAGRFPDRIAQGLFTMDLMVLLGFILYFGLGEKKGILKLKSVCITGGLVLTAVFAVIIKDGTKMLNIMEEQGDIYQERWYGIKNYCQEHQENRYFLSGGSQTLFYFSDDIFETKTIGKPQNFYTNTNFDSPSPNFYDMIGAEYESYLGDDMIEQDNHYWIYEKGCFSEEVDIVKFYKTEYDTFTYELVDTFDTGSTTFEVYYFDK